MCNTVKLIEHANTFWTECIQNEGSDLDKLALKILQAHNLNHFSCVVIYLHTNNNTNEETYIITTNGFNPVEAVMNKLGLYNYAQNNSSNTGNLRLYSHFTQNHLSDMHAEMKLLSVLVNDYNYEYTDLSGIRIGVSKPCCCLCHIVLTHYGVIHSMRHNDPVNWLSPYPAVEPIGVKNCEYDDNNYPHMILYYPHDFMTNHGVEIDFDKIENFKSL